MRLSPLERLKERFKKEQVDLTKIKGLILATAFTKGGTGKSTASYNIAVIAAHLGMDVLGIDADDQQNLEGWAATRREEERSPTLRVEARTGRMIGKYINDRASEYNLTIVDAGGFSSVELREVCKIAHFLMAPVVPSKFNTDTFDQIEKVVLDANATRDAPVKVHLFVSRGSTHSAHKFTKHKRMALSVEQYHELLKADGVDDELFCLMDAQVRSREAHGEAEEIGCGIVELPLGSDTEKAAEEVCDLFFEVIMRALGKYHA